MYSTTTFTVTIPLLVIACLRIYGVQAFVSYVPAPSDSDDDTYDVTNQQPPDVYDDGEGDDDVLFRLLNKIILKGLQKHHLQQQQQGLDDVFEGNPNLLSSVYGPSKRVPGNYLKQKRKVFWQPLGYLPAGTNIAGKQNSHSNAGGSRGQVFRYGK